MKRNFVFPASSNFCVGLPEQEKSALEETISKNARRLRELFLTFHALWLERRDGLKEDAILFNYAFHALKLTSGKNGFLLRNKTSYCCYWIVWDDWHFSIRTWEQEEEIDLHQLSDRTGDVVISLVPELNLEAWADKHLGGDCPETWCLAEWGGMIDSPLFNLFDTGIKNMRKGT